MKRILFISLFYEPDRLSSAYIASTFGRNFQDIDIFTTEPFYNPDKSNYQLKIGENRKVNVNRVAMPKADNWFLKALGLFWFHIKLFLYLLRFGYDVVIISSPPPTILLVVNLFRIHSIVYIAQEVYPAVLGNKLKIFHNKIYKLILTADVLVVINSYGKEYYRKHPNIKLIPNYSKKFDQTATVTDSNIDTPYYIYAGNIGELIDYDKYFEFSKILLERNCKMIFVGDGIKRKWFAKAIRSNPSIELIPYQDKNIVSNLILRSCGAVIFLKQEALMYGFPSKIPELRINGVKILSNYSHGDALYMDYNGVPGIFSVELGEMDKFFESDNKFSFSGLDVKTWISEWDSLLNNIGK